LFRVSIAGRRTPLSERLPVVDSLRRVFSFNFVGAVT